MSDLISRADVLKFPIRLDCYDKENGNREFVLGIESVMDYIESLPSAEKRGRWIEEVYGGISHYSCNLCGDREMYWGQKYCGHCGARMEEEDEED